MMKNKGTKIAFLLFAALTVVSCTKEDAFNYSDLEHTAEWIFPVAKTEISAEQFTKINDLRYDVGVVTLDAPFLTTGLPTPPISAQSIGPLDLEGTDSLYVQFKSDNAIIKIYITNNFPINIKAGTVVEIRNSVNNTDVVFEGVIQNDIAAKGGMDSVIVNKVGTSEWVDNRLKLYLTNFGSDGSPNVEDYSIYNNIEIQLGIEVLILHEIELYGNINYIVTDTTDFDFGSTDNVGEIKEENIRNIKMNVFVKNGTPLTFAIRGYFLDANYAVLDSVFNNAVIPSALIDPNGFAVMSTVVEQKIVEELNTSQFSYLKNRTQHIYYLLEFTSQPENVSVVGENHVKLEVTAEIESKITL